MTKLRRRGIATAVLAWFTIASPSMHGKDKKATPAAKEPQDEILVIGHIDGSQPIRRFVSTSHFSRSYLYGERSDGTMILVDVTKPSQPAVLAEVAAADAGANHIVAVAGAAALVADGRSDQTPDPPQTIRIIDFSDPRHPSAVREFRGVTAMTRDERRGLIFLSNAEGIWILQRNFALDPEVEKEYTRHVLYDH